MMKKKLACILSVMFLAMIFQGCGDSGNETKAGTIQSGQLDLNEFTLTYNGEKYTIFTKMGSAENILKGDFIGSAEPNGEVKVGEEGDPENGVYNVYECLGDETTYNLLGLDYSTLLVYEYGTNENDTYYYWMAPEGFGQSQEETQQSFEEYVSEAIENDELFEIQ